MKIIAVLIWRPFRTFWSNYYWLRIKKARTDYPVKKAHKRKKSETATQYINRICDVVMDGYEYKYDGVEELGDSTPPPAEMYAQLVENEYFADDCDGYHACLYHLAKNAGIDCTLLTMLSAVNKHAHCVLLYEDELGCPRIHDYLNDYGNADTRDEVIEKHYLDLYGGTMITFETVYDGKWVSVPCKHVLRKDK